LIRGRGNCDTIAMIRALSAKVQIMRRFFEPRLGANQKRIARLSEGEIRDHAKEEEISLRRMG
jgi:hypothetical protein